MTRKRLWEIGATAALLLTVGAAVCGFLWWRERQKHLNAALASALGGPAAYDPQFDHQRNLSRIRKLIQQGADVHTKSADGYTALIWAADSGDAAWVDATRTTAV